MPRMSRGRKSAPGTGRRPSVGAKPAARRAPLTQTRASAALAGAKTAAGRAVAKRRVSATNRGRVASQIAKARGGVPSTKPTSKPPSMRGLGGGKGKVFTAKANNQAQTARTKLAAARARQSRAKKK
jgi:hypothetical protein